MGQCQSKKSTRVTPIPNARGRSFDPSQNQQVRCTVMISYCWDDRVVCHNLADHLNKDGFDVIIDRKRLYNGFDPVTAGEIDESDCFLLCLSESYVENHYCQKEARYASDQKKSIIVVAVTPNYIAKGWIGFIIFGKPYFNLAESGTNFKKAYTELVKTLLRHVRPDPFRFWKPHSSLPQEQIEQRRAIYEAALRKKIEKDRPITKEAKQQVDQVLESIGKEPDEENPPSTDTSTECHNLNPLKYWKEKYPEVTWSNVPPFTSTGDINDAPFALPSSVESDRNRRLNYWIKHHQFYESDNITNATQVRRPRRSNMQPMPLHYSTNKVPSNKD